MGSVNDNNAIGIYSDAYLRNFSAQVFMHFGVTEAHATLAAENYEGIAVERTSKGTMIFIVSDDNYSSFQQTLLLQFFRPDAANEPLTSHTGP